MDLSTTYLGFKLSSPIVPGASPLSDNLDLVRRLEDAGAPMIIMHSLFEEQIEQSREQMLAQVELTENADAEARSYFPDPVEWNLGPEQYLGQLRRIKAAVAVPVVASLNGTSNTNWVRYAGLLQQAGADALELNIYFLATDPAETSEEIETRVLGIVSAVRRIVTIPIAVKLSPFFSSLPNLARRLDAAGARGLVLFNRFYQPDIDIETLETVPSLQLSNSSELLLRLRWIAILSGRIQADLALTGGVHTAEDVIKGLMSGASCVQTVSSLLLHAPEYLRTLRETLAEWMEKNEYESVSQMIGSMSLLRSPNPAAYERTNYARLLQTVRV